MVRLGGGFGLPAPSAQRDALGEDGYNTGTRLWLTLDASLLASQRVGFGAWAAAWRAQDDPDDGGPTLHEKAFLGGFQMPLLFPTGRATAMLVPRLGIATGSVDFGTSDYKTSVAYGMEMGLLFRLGDGRRLLHPSLGACVGALWAPSSRPGELGRENNLGGFYFALVGGLDG